MFAAAVAVAGATPVFAIALVEHYVGTAYDASGRELFREAHWIGETSGRRELLVLFQCLDGTPFARKFVRESSAAHAPSFTLEDARTGYREGVRDSAYSREVFVRTAADEPERSSLLATASDVVVDAGLDGFIRERWDPLATGARRPLQFVVPSRLRSYTFALSLAGEALVEGRPVRRFLMELDAWYAFAIPPIELTYAADTKTIVEYQGIANVRDRNGKSLKVRIAYSARTPAASTGAGSMETARTIPLDGSCVL